MKNTRLGNTIESVVKSGLCCGCATCAGICPHDAIHMEIERRRGVYLPYIDQQKCAGCALCYKVCPGWEVNIPRLSNTLFPGLKYDNLAGSYDQCYIAYAIDNELRYNCASGGLVTAFLLYALGEGMINGALVTRMDEEHPLKPKVFIARTGEGIISAACSKYIPVPANIALREILDAKQGRYAVVGLPCHLHGLRKAEAIFPDLREKIVFRLGILCAKNISLNGTKFQLQRMRIERDTVKKMSYRGEGWPGYMTIRLKNGQGIVKQKLPEYYDSSFGAFVMPRCTLCVDGAAELGDVSFGDAWLPEIKMRDRLGTSLIIIRDEHLNHVFLSAEKKGLLKLEPITINEINRSQNFFEWKKKELSARFLLNRLMGRTLPDYGMLLPRPDLRSIVSSLILASKMLLTSYPSLWKLLNVYCSILEWLGKYKQRIGNKASK